MVLLFMDVLMAFQGDLCGFTFPQLTMIRWLFLATTLIASQLRMVHGALGGVRIS
eukprot:m.115911 g.115911  ORF g.115911 m.115911 type:complete len:55 (+) comp37571_c0_seq12:716-880(+)